jgi:hypothetical protein
MKCPKCGKRVSSTDRVCKHCGKRLARPQKETKAKIKIPHLAQLPTSKLLTAGIVGLVILIALVLAMLPGGGTREEGARLERPGEEINIERGKSSREIATNAVYGKVMATHLGATRRGTMTARSLHTGKVYTFSVGWHTSYHPQRQPSIGEMITVHYLSEGGDLMKATQVKMNQ